jgi:hypothetical protein
MCNCNLIKLYIDFANKKNKIKKIYSKWMKKGRKECLYYLIMFLHSCAHILQAWAHILHSSILSWNFSHSMAHASHVSAHILHTCFTFSLPLDIKQEAIIHISIQSRIIIMHLVIMPTMFLSIRQAVQQASQHSQHLLQASMHVWYVGFWSFTIFVLLLIVLPKRSCSI